LIYRFIFRISGSGSY